VRASGEPREDPRVSDRRAFVTSPRLGSAPGKPLSDHFDGYRFRNPGPNARGFRDFVKWIRTRRRGSWREFTDSPPVPPPPRRVADLRVTFVNHATVLIQLNDINVLTDPVWSNRVSPVSWIGPRRRRPAGIRFQDLPQVDLVLISHDHYDHLDLPTLRLLESRDRPSFLCGLRVGRLLRRQRLSEVIELDWWETVRARRSLSVASVPVQHFSGRSPFLRNRTLWTGFVLSGSVGNVFFAGDTGYGHHFGQIRERFEPIRLALLPIGAYKPAWFMGPVHMSPVEALAAHRDLRAETSVGIHHGTFELADDGEEEPRVEIERLVAEASEPKPRFWILKNGEGRDLPTVSSDPRGASV
jgi:L-ascorbate metabolism protein UlaG (beta-lactamase superfamily)